MSDKVILQIEFDGKKYGTTRKVTYQPSDKNMIFREAIKALNFIFEDLEKDLLKEALEKAKEELWNIQE